MASPRSTSRNKYRIYKEEVRKRREQLAEELPDFEVASNRHRGKRNYQRSFFELFTEFIGLLRGHRGIVAACLGTVTIATGLSLLVPLGTKVIFDTVSGDAPAAETLPSWVPLPDNPSAVLTAVAIGMVSLTALSQAFNIWGRWHMTRTTKRVQVGVRRKVFDHAVRLPLHRVYDLKSGGVASILREDAGGVAELLFAMLYNPWRAIIQLIGSMAILAWADWRMLIGALTLIPITWYTHRTWISRIRPMYRDIRQSRTRVDSHATEVFGGMRVVRAFGRQRSEARSFTANNHLMARQELYVWWWARGVDIVWQIAIPTAIAALLWYGGHRILDDRAAVAAGQMTAKEAFTIGDLGAFVHYLGMLLGPIATLANSATGLQNSLAGLDRILDLLDEGTELTESRGTRLIDPDKIEGHVAIKDLQFSYTGSDEEVIRHLDLDIKAGQTVALVGPSGAGKTTLCNLIARFYKPSGGSISIDGIDLMDIHPDSYRQLLGIVEQDVFLFDGSIADNIGYGRRYATREQVVEAAKLANAHEFIVRLDDGYESYIGERGVKLSGGQRQRLAIARALLADPRILILDEATSNLDTESEQLIQVSLERLMRGRTSFVIAHRLSTIRHADVIVVLENGSLTEAGTHDELMDRSGRYREMVELQTRPPQLTADEEDDKFETVSQRQ